MPIDDSSDDEDEHGNIKKNKMPFDASQKVAFDSEGKLMPLLPVTAMKRVSKQGA